MRFIVRSLMGLFLLALTIGILALAAGSVRNALLERWARETHIRPASERVFAVNVVLAKSVTASPRIRAFGEIRSRRTLDLRAPLGGTIIELARDFIEGGKVVKGQLLLRLDPVDMQAALDVAETEMSEARAELSEATAALVLAKDEVAAARAQADLRKAALARQQNLLKRSVGTEAAVETAALAESAADQMVLGKRQSLAQAEARLNRANTMLARQNIHLKEAKRRLAETEIHADFDGILSSVSVVEGGLVGNNEKIARLIDPAALEVAFRLSNTQFARLVADNDGIARGEVTVRLDLFGEDVIANGTIERVSAEVGSGQTGRQLFARLPASSSVAFRPGDFVSVEVTEPELSGVAILPAAAVDSAGRVLVLGDDDRLQELSLTVLRKQDDQVIVRGDGLFGREVVAARSPLLGVGIRVKPVRQNSRSEVEVPEMIELTPERRARLMSFVEKNGLIPGDAKKRLLARLKQDKVPAEMVNRIESRMGG